MQEQGILRSEPKLELIEGELIEMASQNAPHMLAKQALNRLLMRLEPAIAYHIEGTLRLSPHSAPDPDVFVHAPDLRPDAVRGPDTLLVIEVSDTTLADDLGWKADLYARHGVPEYWVLDVNSRTITVHKEPRQDGYALIRKCRSEDLVVPERITGLQIRAADMPPF